MAPVYEFLFFLVSQLVLLLLVAGDGKGNQGECPPSFDCGYLHNISFPFTKTGHQDCGLLTIQNCDDSTKRKEIQLENNGKRFEVMQVFQFHPALSTIQIRDNDFYKLLQSRNCGAFYNYTIPASFRFASFRLTSNSSLFKCNRTLHVNRTKDMYNYTGCPDYNLYYGPSITDGPVSSLTACTMIDLPSKDLPDAKDPFTFISANILIEVHLSDECANCHYYKRGQCQLNSKGKFFCANGYEKTGKMKLIVATAASAVGVAVLMVLALLFRTKTFPTAYLLFWKKENPTHHIIEAFLKEHGPLPTVRYSYLEVKKMTNSFRNKLGQGGYGNVYKGKLHDGCLVAVKVLNESKGNGEDFINEVASISRTSHVNIVSLMGFCLEGSKMALIYEFMPNGSLEKFIYEEKIPSVIDRQFNCKTLYDIAIGVARGLEYLHRGCNTRILHFDIKPHNILLDEDFCPKISDFGLAKICPRKESIVSILDVRGTVGYIAPELFSRNFGGVSHKSDVYSYGMMVLEMVGGRQNNNVQADCSSEIYFPHWIYKRLELNQELGLWYIKNESDKEMVRKMTLVSLWCIQTKPSSRPTMSKVVEMLEGSLEVLQIPPKTYLSSPSTSPHFSCETCESL